MRKLILVAALITLIYPSGPVSAIDNPTLVTQPINAEAVAIDAWRKTCPKVQANLDDKIVLFTERRDAHLEKYQMVLETFQGIVSTLDDAGFNTDSITEQIPELEARIKIFSDTADKFIQRLMATDELACGEYVLFMTTLDDSRAGLRGTRLAASDIKQFVGDVLIPSVRNVLAEGS